MNEFQDLLANPVYRNQNRNDAFLLNVGFFNGKLHITDAITSKLISQTAIKLDITLSYMLS